MSGLTADLVVDEVQSLSKIPDFSKKSGICMCTSEFRQDFGVSAQSSRRTLNCREVEMLKPLPIAYSLFPLPTTRLIQQPLNTITLDSRLAVNGIYLVLSGVVIPKTPLNQDHGHHL